jgi:hypothetical protein
MIRRSLRTFFVSGMVSVLLGVVAGPAFAARETTLEECLRGGGHASGKYCSRGLEDGSLIGG